MAAAAAARGFFKSGIGCEVLTGPVVTLFGGGDSVVTRGTENHLDDAHEEDTGQGDCAGHRRVVGGPEARQTRIPERDEGCWKQMNKCSSKQDTGAKVAEGEQASLWDTKNRESKSEEGNRACETRNEQDDEQRADMKGRVVVNVWAIPRAAGVPSSGKLTEGS